MRAHRFDGMSLVFGVVFAWIGLTFLRAEPGLWTFGWAWLWPALLLAAAVLVLGSIWSDVRANRRAAESGPPPDDVVDRYLNEEDGG